MGYFMPFNGSINPDGRGALAAAIVVVDETREDTEAFKGRAKRISHREDHTQIEIESDSSQ
jgi:hypothetical protein